MSHLSKRFVAGVVIAMSALASTPAALAQRMGPGSYVQTIVVDDVKVQYVRGELRFCEQRNVKGLICRDTHHPLGKITGRPMARDWWSPETYVAALTGRHDFTVESVSSGRRHNSLAISFYFD